MRADLSGWILRRFSRIRGGEEPKPEKNFRLVMNMQSFLSTFDTMKKLAERMVEIGVLKRNLTEKVDD